MPVDQGRPPEEESSAGSRYSSQARNKPGPAARLSEEEKKKKKQIIQQRYRDRKKAMQEEMKRSFESAVATLRSEVVENRNQRIRLQLMESILSLRDEMTGLLQEAGRKRDRDYDSVTEKMVEKMMEDEGGSGDAKETSTSEDCSSSSGISVEMMSLKNILDNADSLSELWLSEFGGESLMMVKSGDDMDSVIHRIRVGLEDQQDTGRRFFKKIYNGYKSGDFIRFTEDFSRRLAEIFSSVGLPLEMVCRMDQAEYDEARLAAVQKIKPLYTVLTVSIHLALMHDPLLIREILHIYDNRSATSKDVVTRHILDMVHLSKDQQQRMCLIREAFTKKQEIKLRSMSRSYWMLEDKFRLGEDATAASSLQEMTLRYLKLFEASGKFIVDASDELELTGVFGLMADLSTTFTFLQKCVMFVLSSPSFPDLIHLADMVSMRQTNSLN